MIKLCYYIFYISLIFALSYLLYPGYVYCGKYIESAHGNSSYGVNRTSLSTFGYSIGNCAHCHEQHASIGGDEPNPTGGPSIYALFYPNHTSQTDNFCFMCHKDLGSYQVGGLTNRSYSYRAGGYTADSLDDVLEAFTNPPSISYHNLDSIKSFISDKSWGYTSGSNPCGGCHNPHRAQRDPHISVNRGWPVSRPSQHNINNNEWGLWGDNVSDDPPYEPVGERMFDYVGTLRYQAPYRYGSTTTYEPDNSTTTQDGSNLTDYVTFCQDCHSSSMISYGLLHTPIDWATGDKHGKTAATATIGNYIDIKPPFSNTYGGQYVLACTDCHEPHGAHNVMLIRKEVNGAVLLGTISTITPVDCTAPYQNGNNYLGYLCNRCHKDDADAIGGGANKWCYVHHESTDAFYTGGGCTNCHLTVGGGGGGGKCNRTVSVIDCNCCHYHGSTYTYGATIWRTF